MEFTIRIFYVLATLAATVQACNLAPELEERSAHVTQVATAPVSTPTELPELPPTPTPLSGELEVRQIAAYQSADGAWEVIGLISNGTEIDVVDVQILVQSINGTGNVTGEERGATFINQLPSGGDVPFHASGFEDAGPDSQFLALVDQVRETELIQPELEIIDATLVADADQIHLVGRIVNHSDLAVTIRAIAAAVFDPDLFATASAQVWIGHLDPGEDGPFRISIPNHGRESSDHRVYLDAQFTQLARSYPIEVTSVRSYQDQSGTYHLIGEVAHSHASALHTRLIAAIYDTEGDLMDAAFVDPAPSSNSGDRIPFVFSNWGPLNSIPELEGQIESFIIQWDPQWTFEPDVPASQLSIENVQIEPEQGGLIVRGAVNVQAHEQVHIVAGVRDTTSGILQGVNTFLLKEIDAGTQAEFEVFIPLEAGIELSSLEPFAMAWGMPSAGS